MAILNFMADLQIQKIRSIYGEILGIADHLPDGLVVNSAVTNLYNSAIDELSTVSNSDYSRFRVNQDDFFRTDMYKIATVKPKMGSVLARLEQEFGFYKPSRGEYRAAPVIMTVNNNNQLNITITPIQEVINTINDNALRADVEALKAIIEGDKNKARASSLLNKIQQRSWEVFIAILPVVLERLGR
jgi:hypothetical protein